MCPSLKALTFETQFYLGNILVVKQKTLTVTRPKQVIDALKRNNLVVIKNHGVLSVGEEFIDVLYLIETLEAAVRVAAVARLFKEDLLDELDNKLKEDLNF